MKTRTSSVSEVHCSAVINQCFEFASPRTQCSDDATPTTTTTTTTTTVATSTATATATTTATTTTTSQKPTKRTSTNERLQTDCKKKKILRSKFAASFVVRRSLFVVRLSSFVVRRCGRRRWMLNASFLRSFVRRSSFVVRRCSSLFVVVRRRSFAHRRRSFDPSIVCSFVVVRRRSSFVRSIDRSFAHRCRSSIVDRSFVRRRSSIVGRSFAHRRRSFVRPSSIVRRYLIVRRSFVRSPIVRRCSPPFLHRWVVVAVVVGAL